MSLMPLAGGCQGLDLSPLFEVSTNTAYVGDIALVLFRRETLLAQHLLLRSGKAVGIEKDEEIEKRSYVVHH